MLKHKHKFEGILFKISICLYIHIHIKTVQISTCIYLSFTHKWSDLLHLQRVKSERYGAI